MLKFYIYETRVIWMLRQLKPVEEIEGSYLRHFANVVAELLSPGCLQIEVAVQSFGMA